MALHPNFPASPHAILDPAMRWFPADDAFAGIFGNDTMTIVKVKI